MEYMFNQNILATKGSASLILSEKGRMLKAQGIDVIALSGGEPDFDTPAKIQYTAIREMTAGNTHYCDAKGILTLRKRIAQKLREENNISCTENNILVTPGGKMGVYMAVLAMLNHGDEVLIIEPCWVSYAPIVTLAGGVPVAVRLDDTDNYAITREKLEAVTTPRTKMLIVNSPCNPNGKMLSTNEINQIIEYISDKNIVVLTDEMYEKVVYSDSPKHISLASYDQIKDKVITLNGFSKAVAMTGWRLGYVCANEQIIDVMYRLGQHTISCVSPFIQEAAAVGLDCLEDMEEMRSSYERRRNFFITEINKIPGVSANMPEGAFYAWVKFDIPGMDSYQIAEYLLDHARVVGVPGQSYGKSNDKYVRFSFATKMEYLQEAVKRIAEAMTAQKNVEA